MKSNSAIILFAPKFKEFGVALARKLITRGMCDKVYGLATGGKAVVEYVKKNLNNDLCEIWDLAQIEENIPDSIQKHNIKKIDEQLEPGAIGYAITSDRRVGAGFVRGGLVRPSWLKTSAKHEPLEMPVRYGSVIYEFLSALVMRANPRFVFLYAIAAAPAVILAQICGRMMVPVLNPVSARVSDLIYIDQFGAEKKSIINRVIDAEKLGSLCLKAEKKVASSYLIKYRGIQDSPSYMAFNEARRREQRVIKLLMLALGKTIYGVSFSGLSFRVRLEMIKRAWFDVQVLISRKLFSLDGYSGPPPEWCDAIYFPLHVDPEASTMVIAPLHTDQLNVIESIAKSMPASTVLFVKENPAMYGKRPRGFYRAIREMPRVALLDESEKSIDWIKKSVLTIVITGTAGFEALMLRRKALIIRDVPYTAIGEGFVREECLAGLPRAIDMALKMKCASDESIVKYLSALFYVSFSFDMGIMWGENIDYTSEKVASAVDAYSSGIEMCLRFA